MSATISVSFYARQSRAKEDGQSPIFMRVKLGKDYFDTNTKLFTKPESWSGPLGKAKGNGEQARFTNALLDSFKSKVPRNNYVR